MRYLLLLTALLANKLFASNIGNDIAISDMFKPLDGDISIRLIQNLFGGTHMVDALSNVPQNLLVTKVFSILNVGVLSIAGFLLSYTVFTGVMRTAQDGGMSQIGKLSPMTLFRIITGFTVMSPIPSVGFSVVQAGILWAAVHGVGFADTIYSKIFLKNATNTENVVNANVAEYKKINLKVLSARNKPRQEQANYISKELANLYSNGVTDQSEVIVYSLLKNVDLLFDEATSMPADNTYNDEQKDALANLLKPNLDDLSETGSQAQELGLNELYAASMCLATIKVGQPYATQTFAVRQGKDCGAYNSNVLCFGFDDDRGYCGTYEIKNTKPEYLKNFFNSIYNNLTNLISEKYLSNYNKYMSNSNATAEDLAQIKTNSYILSDNSYVTNLTGFAKDLIQIREHTEKPLLKLKEKKDQGWVTAGFKQQAVMDKFSPLQKLAPVNEAKLDQFSRKIISIFAHMLNSETGDVFGSKPSWCPSFAMISCDETYNVVPFHIRIFLSRYLSAMTGISINIDKAIIEKLTLNEGSGFKQPNECTGNNGNCYNALVDKNMVMPSGILGIAKNSTMQATKESGLQMLGSVGEFWQKIPQAILMESGKMLRFYRSIITIAGVVSALVQSGLEFIPYVGAYIANGVDILTEGIITIPQVTYQIDINNMFRFLPAMGFISVMVLTSGFLLSIWVQILPVLIYSLAIIGWLFYLIEALVAAPIIAVGITHPEGHDFLGQAQQSFMLLMMVFLRPVLILMGFMTSLVIFNSSVYILNIGFLDMFDFLAPTDTMNVHTISIVLAMLFVYTVVIAGVAQLSFMSIFRVVERVNIWLGGQPDQSPIGQIVSKLKGDMLQKTQQVGMGAGGEMSDAGVKSNTGGKGEIDSSTLASKAMNAKSKGGAGAKTS